MSSSSQALSNEPARRIRIDSRRRWFPDIREFLRYRQLIVLLGRRDITAKIRQTALGTAWILAGPLVSAGLFAFVFGRIAGLPSGGNSYFVFAYAGLLAWNVYAGTLGGAATSLTGSAALITKIYFPRLVIPAASFAAVLLNTLISFVVMDVLLLISGTGISIQIVLLPFFLFLGVALAMGLALGLTAISVAYRDINYATPLLTQVLLYLSPVAYSVAAVPANLRTLYLLNPLATIVECSRWCLLGGPNVIPIWAIAYTVVLTSVVLVGGLMTFARREGTFADVV